MSGQPRWVLDALQQQYYYWDAQNNCYVYQNGEVVYPSDPPADESTVLSNVEVGPPEQITEERALRVGIRAHKKLRETPGEAERLDPRYRKHYPGREFYKVGKVFKVLWPEPAGNPQSGVTFITGSFGEFHYDKIRWFVVIREGRDCCTCLPIQTYNKKGVSKPGVVKSEHSIMYAESYPPQLPVWDDPNGEMLQAIPVVTNDPTQSKMDDMSRLNYAKPYTVEHNVKSFDFGDVPPDWVPTLRQNFASVLQLGQIADPSTPPPATRTSRTYSSPDYRSPASHPYSSSPSSSRGPSQYYSQNTGAGADQSPYTDPRYEERSSGYYSGYLGYSDYYRR